MSSFDSPKVLLLSKAKNPVMQQMLKDIHTSVIPFQFLDSVFITVGNDERYKLQKTLLKDGLDYKNIESHLSSLGISREVSLIEVIIDLDNAYSTLQAETTAMLDELFEPEQH